MEYRMYSELCDRINSLLEEQKELTCIIDSIPRDMRIKLIKAASKELKIYWLRYMERRRKDEKN